ncbi:MAG: translesion error-prone DNA polymerase V autoproteolytic subunit [Alistipes sp.]
MIKNTIAVFRAAEETVELPLAESVKAGFPSPADDFPDSTLNITREIVKNPASTFYARVSGDSMIDDGIDDGDILVVDKSVEPYNGCVAICFIDGEFTLKHFEAHEDYALLVPANQKYKPIRITADNDFLVWGVVRYVVKKL